MKIFLIILILIFAPDTKPDDLLISSKINAVLPEGMSVQSVKKSQIENLYIVDIGDLQPIYASKNGEFFFYGELYAVNGNMLQNTTKDEINLKRKSILDEALSEGDFITFKSDNEKHRMIIFNELDSWKAFRLGSPSVALPDILCVNNHDSKIFTIEAIIIPIKPINKNEPRPVKSRFVV